MIFFHSKVENYKTNHLKSLIDKIFAQWAFKISRWLKTFRIFTTSDWTHLLTQSNLLIVLKLFLSLLEWNKFANEKITTGHVSPEISSTIKIQQLSLCSLLCNEISEKLFSWLNRLFTRDKGQQEQFRSTMQCFAQNYLSHAFQWENWE